MLKVFRGGVVRNVVNTRFVVVTVKSMVTASRIRRNHQDLTNTAVSLRWQGRHIA